MSSQTDDDEVTQGASEKADDVTDQSGNINQASCSSGEMIRAGGKDLGKGVVGDDARSATKGKKNTRLRKFVSIMLIFLGMERLTITMLGNLTRKNGRLKYCQ